MNEDLHNYIMHMPGSGLKINDSLQNMRRKENSKSICTIVKL